ncbi:MAG: hypothetical protein R3F62_29415 [Planctomycetota bacterium]
MSRALLLRELKRHAPWAALFAAVVGVTTAAVFLERTLLGDPQTWSPVTLETGYEANRTTLNLATLVLAWTAFVAGLLAGVLALAPDTARGGTAFLFRMPLSAGQIARTKVAALGAYLPGLVLLLTAGALLQPVETRVMLETGDLNRGDPSTLLPLGGLFATALTCGLVSTVILGRALPALLLGGILTCAAGFGLLAVPFLAFGTDPRGLFVPAVALFGASALAAAWAAFSRGSPHHPTFKPALYAGALLLPAGLLLVGGTGVAQAWTVRGIEPDLELTASPAVPSVDGRHLAVSLVATPWCGPEYRVAVVDREAGTRWIAPCANAWRPEFSPDGTRLLVRKRLEPGGYVIDVAQRTATEFPGRSRDGFGYRFHTWVESGPLFVEQRGQDLVTWQPLPGDDDDPLREERAARAREAAFPLPRPMLRLVGVTGGEALLADGEGLWSAPLPRRVQLEGAASEVLRVPAPRLRLRVSGALEWIETARVSPSGRYLLALRANDDDSYALRSVASRAHVFDLEQGRLAGAWDSELASLDTQWGAHAFDPDERRVATFNADQLTVHSVDGGAEVYRREVPVTTNDGWRLCLLTWSAAGEQLALSSLDRAGGGCQSLVHPLDRPHAVIPLGSQPVVGFVDAQRLLVANQPLGALELAPAREER